MVCLRHVKTDPCAAEWVQVNVATVAGPVAWLYPSQEDQKGMLSVEDWAEIRRLHRAEGLPIKVIARELGISKNTVKTALASEQPPKYQRLQGGSIVDEVEPGSGNCCRPIRGCRPR